MIKERANQIKINLKGWGFKWNLEIEQRGQERFKPSKAIKLMCGPAPDGIR